MAQTRGGALERAAAVPAETRERIEELKSKRDAVILAHYYVEPEVQAVADYVGDSFYLAKLAVPAETRERIEELKSKRDAVILAHYYVEPEVQAVADYVGDSFYLAKLAKTLPQQTIVLCGVEFMGESAKLLNRDKTVLLPEPAADCPMAHMVRRATILPQQTIVLCGVEFMGESAKLLNRDKTVLLPEPAADCPMAHMVRRATIDGARAEYGDDLAVVCYVNSTMEIKSWSDVCVTSSNAVKIVRELPQHHILFIPDRNLGRHVAQQVPEKHVILNDGCCPRHEAISLAELRELKSAHPRRSRWRTPSAPRRFWRRPSSSARPPISSALRRRARRASSSS